MSDIEEEKDIMGGCEACERDTSGFGEGVGCALMILAMGVVAVGIIWALTGFVGIPR